MRYEFGLEHVVHDDRSLVTVGSFDGVHLGHQAILTYLVQRAREQHGRSVVVTFDPHPREVVTGNPMPLLTTVNERAAVMQAHGLDRLVVLPFTQELAKMPPERFVLDLLVGRVGLREIIIGYDHAFGKGRSGDRALLESLATKNGFTLDVIPQQAVGEQVVSSTVIRDLLTESGAVDQASVLLGRPYSLSGTVIRGAGRGRSIGYPTANVAVDHPRKVIPRTGVYAVLARIDGDDVPYGGMMNIGRRPTFSETELQLEVHLFDVSADLYDQTLTLSFIERLRDERRFESVEALKRQLAGDERRSREILSQLV